MESIFSLNRLRRQRREFIYKRSIETRDIKKADRKRKFREAVEHGEELPNHMKKKALKMNDWLDWDDEGGGAEGDDVNIEDDEYRWAGVEDPRVVVTTSRDPSSKLKQFASELKHVFPNANRINRGNFEVKALIDACEKQNVTDLVIIGEHRGTPNSLIISHLPYGPTATFTLYNVLTRHDMVVEDDEGNKMDMGKMPEQYPHLVMEGWKDTKLAVRTKNILRYLFPVPKPDAKRVVSMVLLPGEDYIRFRNYTYKLDDKGKAVLTDHGPRFDAMLYKIQRGPLHEKDVNGVEYVLRPYMNTAYKRTFLSEDAVKGANETSIS